MQRGKDKPKRPGSRMGLPTPAADTCTGAPKTLGYASARPLVMLRDLNARPIVAPGKSGPA